ncbi:MAG: aldolase catalytic domain-containing protein [Methanoregulaceae archaeon]|jgi:4-hydroxy 2-oxovalerate aldolase
MNIEKQHYSSLVTNPGVTLVDCTLRDGGYYNSWDFSTDLIHDYLEAMDNVGVDYVELGFRSLKTDGFKGACAYTTDRFIKTLNVPVGLKVAVMVNASELVRWPQGINDALEKLFSADNDSPVHLVRIACHYREFEQVLPAATWLKDHGYMVTTNLMQVADRSVEEIQTIAETASEFPVDVLYLADSMGSLIPDRVEEVINTLRTGWSGFIGIHTHDNMGHALENSVSAVKAGAKWVDGTITGMGRGPGNAKTEFLVLEFDDRGNRPSKSTTLLAAIRKHFRPLQQKHGWGSNPYYYLSGKYAIHPTYIQEMLVDPRYNEEDVLAVIEQLRLDGGKSFNPKTLDTARNFFRGEPRGTWNPASEIAGRDVLILGTGPSVETHRSAIEAFIGKEHPFVIALNTLEGIGDQFIDIRAACHPVRLLADCRHHRMFPQPLAAPVSMLPDDIVSELEGKHLLDYGFAVQSNTFDFHDTYCTIPALLVVAYALSLATSGKAVRLFLAGFDGYGADDPRRQEVNTVFDLYQQADGSLPLLSITPTLYDIRMKSVYAMCD